MIAFEFPAPAKRMNMNDRPHWAKKAELTRLWREAAYVHAKAAKIGKIKSPIMVQVTFVVNGNRTRDGHNMAPTVKAITDGLVDAGVVPDDNTSFVTVRDSDFEIVPHKHSRSEHVIVRIWPVKVET